MKILETIPKMVHLRQTCMYATMKMTSNGKLMSFLLKKQVVDGMKNLIEKTIEYAVDGPECANS